MLDGEKAAFFGRNPQGEQNNKRERDNDMNAFFW
jgi:hypothetical protein